jgi:hypothetical protein
LVIGEASIDPELVGCVEKGDGDRHPLLGGRVEGILDLLIHELFLRGLQLESSGGHGAALDGEHISAQKAKIARKASAVSEG